ncbi:cilia- and flagella-associated protein 53 isoform X2 [Chaetodon auriga]|uniref:cilia- and flagella-associated protein 53 isoform X2 n=1 Tax=Chaetodon auriga TaxID=39042 RepID=UPI0040328CC0
MLLSQRRTRCGQFTGPTSQEATVRAKVPPSRPPDQLFLTRQKQDAARDQVLEFSRYQQTWDTKNSWLKSSDRRFQRRTVQRRVQSALNQQDVHVQDRRDRLRALLEEEEQQLRQEMEEKMETSVEREARMKERAKALRDKRETERRQLVSEKLEQLFRERSEELRTLQSRRTVQLVCSEREAQVKSRQERLRRQKQEERAVQELLEEDLRAKEEREAQKEQRQRQRKLQQLDFIRTQMEEAEQQRRQLRRLREEEAALMADMREQQQRYRQCLSEELQKKRREEEETEQLMEEKLKEVWTKREEQSRLHGEARTRLMKEVMEARRLQIQHKLDMDMQRQVEVSTERDKLNRAMEEMKLMDEEEKRRKKQTCEAYQADLRAQVRQQQQLRAEQRAQAEMEHQQGLILQELYNQKKDEILSRPTSHTTVPHPFRRAEGSRSASYVLNTL